MKTVTMGICPKCSGRTAIVELIEGTTSNMTLLGRSYFKCENGCNKDDLTSNSAPALSDSMFSDVISYARSIGKKITKEDRDRELGIYMRANR